MSNHSEENYLDQLLNSLGDENPDSKMPEAETPLTQQEAFEQELFGKTQSAPMDKAKKEEDFLREFEEELLKEDIPNYLDQFEQDASLMSDEKKKKDEEMDSSLDEMLANMPQDEEVPLVDENAEFEGELPEEKDTIPKQEPEKQGDFGGLDMAMDAFDEKMEQTEDGTMDLSGLSDSDLLDMLSGDADLSDLGDMLSNQEEGKPIEEGDSIGAFAEAEMNAQEKATEVLTEAKKEAGKKPSFLKKLSRLFFGEDEEDKVTLSESSSGVDVAAELSAENQQILKELEAAGESDAPSKDKKKKKDKKKDPKPKKEKKKKEPKPKKPKKEKKPKEKDNTPPLPKGPVIAIVIMVASLFGLVMLGTTLLGYQANVNAAKEAYDKGAYVEAFEKMQGLEIKEKDEELYQRLATMAAVSKKYQSYLVFDNYGAKDMALDSLVCAYGRYDLNKKYAKEYDCETELEQLGGKIVKALLTDYDMTGEEALEMYQIKKRDDYSIQLHKKLQELGLE